MLQEGTPKAAQRLIEALDAERPVVVGNGPHATMEMVPDHDVRLKASEVLFSRLYGKPRQEVTGEDGAPLMGAVVPDLLDSMLKLVEGK